MKDFQKGSQNGLFEILDLAATWRHKESDAGVTNGVWVRMDSLLWILLPIPKTTLEKSQGISPSPWASTRPLKEQDKCPQEVGGTWHIGISDLRQRILKRESQRGKFREAQGKGSRQKKTGITLPFTEDLRNDWSASSWKEMRVPSSKESQLRDHRENEKLQVPLKMLHVKNVSTKRPTSPQSTNVKLVRRY